MNNENFYNNCLLCNIYLTISMASFCIMFVSFSNSQETLTLVEGLKILAQ